MERDDAVFEVWRRPERLAPDLSDLARPRSWDAADDFEPLAALLRSAPTHDGSALMLCDLIHVIAEQGVTEIVYQPTGPDITRELEAFITGARAVRLG